MYFQVVTLVKLLVKPVLNFRSILSFVIYFRKWEVEILIYVVYLYYLSVKITHFINIIR